MTARKNIPNNDYAKQKIWSSIYMSVNSPYLYGRIQYYVSKSSEMQVLPISHNVTFKTMHIFIKYLYRPTQYFYLIK